MVALALCLGSGGCGKVRSGPSELVVLIENPVRTLDPRFSSSSYDTKLSRLIAPGLTSADAIDSVPRPLLAESIEQQGPGEYLVTLRADGRFPDGSALTAEDVVFTYRSLLDPAVRATDRAAYIDKGFTAQGIVALDARRVRFRFARPLATFLSDLEYGILSKRATLAVAAQGASGIAVGAGPFRVVSRTDDRVELAPNPFFAPRPPPLERLVFRVVRDDGSRLLALTGGSADLLQNSAAPSPLLLDAVLENPRLKMLSARSATWTYLGMNCEDPLLRDVRVRRAIALAIDKEAIVAAKLRGRAVVSETLLAPSHWAFAAGAKQAYDPARARALLEEAGAIGAEITLKTSTSSKFRLAVARVIRSQLAAVGLRVEVRAYEFGTFFGDVKRGNFQLFTLQLPEATEPDYYYNFFHSSRIPTRDNVDAGGNRFRFRDAEIDALLARGKEVEDREERRRIYGEVQRRLAALVPAVPLWHEDNIAVMRREVQGYALWPNARFSALAGVFKDASAR